VPTERYTTPSMYTCRNANRFLMWTHLSVIIECTPIQRLGVDRQSPRVSSGRRDPMGVGIDGYREVREHQGAKKKGARIRYPVFLTYAPILTLARTILSSSSLTVPMLTPMYLHPCHSSAVCSVIACSCDGRRFGGGDVVLPHRVRGRGGCERVPQNSDGS